MALTGDRRRRRPSRACAAVARAWLALGCVACSDSSGPASRGTAELSIVTTGSGLDADGYQIHVDGGRSVSAPANGTLTIRDVPAGPHVVTVTDVESNCVVGPAARREISVERQQTSYLAVDVVCEARILFASERSGNFDIWVVDPDGSHLRQLTSAPGRDLDPSWSPDYRKILFSSERDGNDEIYVMNADGSGQTNLTRHPDQDNLPAWSPDGRRITYVSRGPFRWLASDDVFVMNADGSSQTRLTFVNYANDNYPRFSPDGRLIAFCSARDGNIEIHLMAPDGSNPRNITHSPETDCTPAWSPGGTRIALSTFRDGNWEVYVMQSDGSAPTNLTRTSGYWEGNPAWSPDGSRIVYESNQSGENSIWIANADGSNPRQLTRGGEDVAPAWGAK
jgi:Tol biopolymer transport system component